MSKFASLSVMAALVCAGAAWPGLAQESPDTVSLRNFPVYWVQDRPAQDDFLPPLSGPGPVMSHPDHPYVPNGAGKQQTNRLADLTNPILKPWTIERIGKTNDAVLAGKVPFIARERCWPTGVPGFLVFAHAAG